MRRCADVPGRQGGFSLLEVVVAFTVLALVLGVLIQIFSQAMATTALGGTYARAAALASSRLAAVGVEIPEEPGSYTGEPEDGLDWRVEIVPFESVELAELDWEPPFQPLAVTALVSWEDARGRRELRLSTLRLGEKL